MTAWQKCFPVNFAKFLRTPVFVKHLWWLLLNTDKWHILCFEAVNNPCHATGLFLYPLKTSENLDITEPRLMMFSGGIERD